MTAILFELSLNVGTEDFNKWFREKDFNGLAEIANDEYADYSYAKHSILFVFRDSTYKKKIKVIASFDDYDDDGNADSDKFIHRLKKKIRKYFDDEVRLDDFVCSAVSLIMDTDLGSEEKVHSYLSVLRRIGKVKKYHPVAYKDMPPKSSFCLSEKSNGIDFLAYAPGSIVDVDFAGVLRTEIRLTGCRAIRSIVEDSTVEEQIAEIITEADSIFKRICTSIVPPGDYYKKKRTVEIINREINDIRLCRKMIKFVSLVAEKKSLLLAQKAMNTRSLGRILKAFEMIGVSPITIGKRGKGQHYQNIH